MGGGDLNLKKSWHPHTLKNQEKVWKAEQAKEHEDTKLNELRREIDDERTREELRDVGENSGVLKRSKGDKQMEWMYRNQAELINRDEYLLGRAVDKNFETLDAEEQRATDKDKVALKQPINHVEHECVPFSLRTYRGMESSEQVDVQRKTLEDPLMQIKKLEMEKRRKLLDNPVKLKKLQELVKIKMSKHKKSKKSKKHKKKKSRSESTDRGSDSQSDSEDDKHLTKKLKKLTQKLKKSHQIPDIRQLVDDIKDERKTKEKNHKKDKRNKSPSEPRRGRKSVSSSPINCGASRIKTQPSISNVRKSYEEEPKYKKEYGHKKLDERHRSKSRSRSREFREKHANKNYASNNRAQVVEKPQRYYRPRSRSLSKEKHPTNRDYTPERRTSKNPFAKDVRNNSPPQSYKRPKSRSPDRFNAPKNPFNTTNKNNNSRRFSSPEKPPFGKNNLVRTYRGSSSRSPSRGRQPKYRHGRSRSRSNDRPAQRNPFSQRKDVSKSQRSRSLSYERQTPRKNPFSRGNDKSQKSRRTRSRSRSLEPRSNRNAYRGSPTKPAGNDKDKAARLREMMDNADWRESDRMRAVTKYRDASAREENQQRTENFDKNFINKQVQNALASQKSVGARLRANLNNIQRSSTAMDSNFARK